MRRLLALFCGLTMLFLLSGCYKVQADFTVNEDSTISGTMIMGMDKKVLEEMGGSAEDFTSELKDDYPEGAKVEEWSDERFVGSKASFEAVPLSEMNDETFTLKKEDESFVMELTGDAENLDDEQMEQAFAEFGNPEVEMVFEFPGKITDHEGAGTVDGNRLIFTMEDLMASGTTRVVADAEAGTNWLLLLIPGLLMVAAAAVFLALRARKDKAHGGSAQGAPASDEGETPPPRI